MKRLILIIIAILGALVGTFLLLNWIEGDLEVAGRSIESPVLLFCLNWFLRIVFFGGGFVSIGIGFFGSEATVSKAFRGFKGAV